MTRSPVRRGLSWSKRGRSRVRVDMMKSGQISDIFKSSWFNQLDLGMDWVWSRRERT